MEQLVDFGLHTCTCAIASLCVTVTSQLGQVPHCSCALKMLGSSGFSFLLLSWGPQTHQSYFPLIMWLRKTPTISSLGTVQFSCSVLSDSLQPYRLQHTRPPCPSPTPRICSNSYPLSWWCHPTISSSVVPFSSCLQSFPASGSFAMSQFFPSGGQSIGASASTLVLPMNIQDWFPLGWTAWISLQSKGFSSVLSNHSSK